MPPGGPPRRGSARLRPRRRPRGQRRRAGRPSPRRSRRRADRSAGTAPDFLALSSLLQARLFQVPVSDQRPADLTPGVENDLVQGVALQAQLGGQCVPRYPPHHDRHQDPPLGRGQLPLAHPPPPPPPPPRPRVPAPPSPPGASRHPFAPALPGHSPEAPQGRLRPPPGARQPQPGLTSRNPPARKSRCMTPSSNGSGTT